LMFNADDAAALDRMLDRFMQHVRKVHVEDGVPEGAPKWRPRRRRRPSPEGPEASVTP
jgi:pyruvate-formate lyase-activating enzyme